MKRAAVHFCKLSIVIFTLSTNIAVQAEGVGVGAFGPKRSDLCNTYREHAVFARYPAIAGETVGGISGGTVGLIVGSAGGIVAAVPAAVWYSSSEDPLRILKWVPIFGAAGGTIVGMQWVGECGCHMFGGPIYLVEKPVTNLWNVLHPTGT